MPFDFLLTTTPVGFCIKVSYATASQGMSSQRPWLVLAWRHWEGNPFCAELYCRSPPTTSVIPSLPQRAEVSDGRRCPPRFYEHIFLFYFVSMWSGRRGAIFGACCGGCFYLAHPLGLVFKPWPSGSGMMRTLFQSPPPKGSAIPALDTENGVHPEWLPPSAPIIPN